jgi:hypothetical protein
MPSVPPHPFILLAKGDIAYLPQSALLCTLDVKIRFYIDSPNKKMPNQKMPNEKMPKNQIM